MTATAHLEDSAEDARSEIYRAVYKKKKWMAEGIFDKILSVAEEVICSARAMIGAERANQKRWGNLADFPAYSIPYPQIKKIAALKNHIGGL